MYKCKILLFNIEREQNTHLIRLNLPKDDKCISYFPKTRYCTELLLNIYI